MKRKGLFYCFVCALLLFSLILTGCNTTDNESTAKKTTASTTTGEKPQSPNNTNTPEGEKNEENKEDGKKEEEEEIKVDSLELLIDQYYLATQNQSLKLKATKDSVSTEVSVTEEMFVSEGYDLPNWDVPGIYNVKVKYGGAEASGKIVVIKNITQLSGIQTVSGKKLMKTDSVADDGNYNQYVDYTNISDYEMVRIKCALWHSPHTEKHTAIIFYDANKKPIATYDASNLFAYGVSMPTLNGGFSYNVDALLSTNGATYVRFSNKTSTGTDDLNANGYSLVPPSIEGYDFGFKFSQAELISSSTNTLGAYAQGGAIWDKYLFQFCDKLERIYIKDLSTNTVVDTHEFAEKHSQYHCNAVTFGTTVYSGYDLPLLYVSMENSAQHKALVYGVTKSGNNFDFELVQTIVYPDNASAGTYYQNCFIDGENGYIYIGGYAIEKWSSNPNDTNFIILKRYALPTLDDGEIYYLDASDALATGTLPFEVATQGGFIKDGLLYQVFGVNSPQRKLKIVDLDTFTILYEFNLDIIGITAEPENVSYYNGYLYVTDVNDRLFRFKFI